MALSCDDLRGSDYSVVTRKSKRHKQIEKKAFFSGGILCARSKHVPSQRLLPSVVRTTGIFLIRELA
jgi:hypothetical protein